MTTLSHAQTSVAAEWAPPSNGLTRDVPAAQTGHRTRLAVAWRAAINYLVPVGYEDDTGFHYGERPESVRQE